MSKYTTQVRYICEHFAGLEHSVGYKDIEQVIENSWEQIFDFDFPVFDEAYRKPLCMKILKHFYTREIGEEVYSLWKLRLNDRLNVIMPYYNKLYEAWAEEFNPIFGVDITRKHVLNRDEDTTGTQEAETTGNNTNRDLYSDTPQGSLQNVENETYLTNARKVTDEANATSNNSYNQNVKTTDNYIEQLTGVQSGGYSEQLMKYREALINIDNMILNELNNLFMLIW